VSKQPPPELKPGSEIFRLVSPVGKSKGKFSFAGCASDGQCHHYEILRRLVNQENANMLTELERGDVLYAGDLSVIHKDLQRLRDPQKLKRFFS